MTDTHMELGKMSREEAYDLIRYHAYAGLLGAQEDEACINIDMRSKHLKRCAAGCLMTKEEALVRHSGTFKNQPTMVLDAVVKRTGMMAEEICEIQNAHDEYATGITEKKFPNNFLERMEKIKDMYNDF